MTRSSNDQRSDALNPNNAEYQASQNNRSNQMNPNNIWMQNYGDRYEQSQGD